MATKTLTFGVGNTVVNKPSDIDSSQPVVAITQGAGSDGGDGNPGGGGDAGVYGVSIPILLTDDLWPLLVSVDSSEFDNDITFIQASDGTALIGSPDGDNSQGGAESDYGVAFTSKGGRGGAAGSLNGGGGGGVGTADGNGQNGTGADDINPAAGGADGSGNPSGGAGGVTTVSAGRNAVGPGGGGGGNTVDNLGPGTGGNGIAYITYTVKEAGGSAQGGLNLGLGIGL